MFSNELYPHATATAVECYHIRIFIIENDLILVKKICFIEQHMYIDKTLKGCFNLLEIDIYQ